ncbi:MAG: hypothetical protein ABIS92_03740 [Polyangia bacterium]
MPCRSSVSPLISLRRSGVAIALAAVAWTGGCATAPRPAIEPAFAARTYTPIRIALLPPDVFMVLDQLGENDPAKSEALRQSVFAQVVKFSTEAFRQRGYDLNLSARWDGVVGQDGQLLVGQDELALMANTILQFANGPAGGRQGPLTPPEIIAPELAAKIGWATQSDALLYVNLKGVTTSDGKRAAQIMGAVLIVAVIVLIVLATLAEGKSGGRGGTPALAGGGGRPVAGPVTRGGAPLGARGPTPGMSSSGLRGAPPVGRGLTPGGGGGGRVYRGGGGGGPHFGIGVGVMIPLDGPGYTHEGQVTHEDQVFGGDQLYLSMTLVNAADGRVLWHLREDLDLDAEDPNDVRELVNRAVTSIPLRGDLMQQTSGTK